MGSLPEASVSNTVEPGPIIPAAGPILPTLTVVDPVAVYLAECAARVEQFELEAGRPEGNSPRRVAGAILLESAGDSGTPCVAYCRQTYWTYGSEPVWEKSPAWPEERLQPLINQYVDIWNEDEAARVEAQNQQSQELAAEQNAANIVAGNTRAKLSIAKRERAKLITDLQATKLRADVMAQLRPGLMIGSQETASGPFWIHRAPGDPEPMNVIPVRNGLLDITDPVKPKLMPHTNRFFTPSLLPFAYEPGAPSPRRFLGILDYQFGKAGDESEDIESKQVILEFLALCLTPNLTFQKFMILKGVAGSGKSTLLDCFLPVIGERNHSALEVQALTNDHGKAALLDKLLVTFNDVRTSDSHDTSSVLQFFLQVVGGDKIHMNPKYKDPFTAKLLARAIVVANQLPNLRDITEALERRTLIVNFGRKVLKKDPYLALAVQRHELPGILNVLLVALARLRSRGHFVQPKSATGLLTQMRDDSSNLFGFLDDCCEVNPASMVGTKVAFAAYQGYAQSTGTMPLSYPNFRRNLIDACARLKWVVKEDRPRDDSGKKLSAQLIGVDLTPGWAKIAQGNMQVRGLI